MSIQETLHSTIIRPAGVCDPVRVTCNHSAQTRGIVQHSRRVSAEPARRRSFDGTGNTWKEAARQGISLLTTRAVQIDDDPILERLGSLLALLLPESHAPEEATEPATPFSESSSRLSFSRECQRSERSRFAIRVA